MKSTGWHSQQGSRQQGDAMRSARQEVVLDFETLVDRDRLRVLPRLRLVSANQEAK